MNTIRKRDLEMLGLVMALSALCTCKPSEQGRQTAQVIPAAIVPDAQVSEWGYRTTGAGERPQGAWENQTFGNAAIRFQAIKALKELPSARDHYCRFTIIEESYPTPEAAKVRGQRLREYDPKLNTKMEPESVLRDGFAFDNKVFIITTDVVLFEREGLPQVLALLKKYVQGADKAR